MSNYHSPLETALATYIHTSYFDTSAPINYANIYDVNWNPTINKYLKLNGIEEWGLSPKTNGGTKLGGYILDGVYHKSSNTTGGVLDIVFKFTNIYKPPVDITIEEPVEFANSKYVMNHASAVNIHNAFGLQSRTYNLVEKLCDYYLLHLVDIMTDSIPAKKTLEHLTDELDDQFRRYTDMIIGGELRHFDLDRYENSDITEQMKPMDNAIRSSNGVLNGDAVGRSSAWLGWFYLRQEYGTLALRWAHKIFGEGSWSTNYGGHAWSSIAKVLISRELEQTTAHTFVDSCWGLQHNTGSYFNKWWSITSLSEYLNHNLEGRYCALRDRASSYVQSLVDRYVSLIDVCQCSRHENKRRDKIEDTRKRTYFAQRMADILHNYTEGEKVYDKV